MTIALEITTLEGIQFAKDVELITMPGVDGEFGVMGGHMPLGALLKNGIVTVDDRKFYVKGGFAEVTPERCRILALDSREVVA